VQSWLKDPSSASTTAAPSGIEREIDLDAHSSAAIHRSAGPVGHLVETELPERRLADRPSLSRHAALVQDVAERRVRHLPGLSVVDGRPVGRCVLNEGERRVGVDHAELVDDRHSRVRSEERIGIGGQRVEARIVVRHVELRLEHLHPRR
jgi:hypothetical protein